MRRAGPLILALLLLALACGESEAPPRAPPGTAPSDAPPPEAGPSGAGPSEAGPSGAGPPEAGPSEAGPSEAGPPEPATPEVPAVAVEARARARRCDVEGRPADAAWWIELSIRLGGGAPDDAEWRPETRVALSDLRAALGDFAGAAGALEPLCRGIPTTLGDAWLVHRLAVRRLQAGDPRGYVREAGRIPRGTVVRSRHARFGIPAESGLVPARVATPLPATEDAIREALDKARETLAAEPGSPVPPGEVLERLARGETVCARCLDLGETGATAGVVRIVAHDPGLRAFVLAGRPLDAMLLVPEESVLDAAALAAYDEVHALADDGKVLAALERAERAVEESPDRPAIRLLLAEALTDDGEVGRALQQLNAIARSTPVVAGTAIDRRIRALAAAGAGEKLDESFAALEAIRKERPDYLAVYEDLYGLYVATYRYRDALGVLLDAGERWPELREDTGYRQTLRLAWLGFAKRVDGREDVERFTKSRDAEFRQIAARLAVKLSEADATAVLAGLAADEDVLVRTLAIRFLGERGYEGGADACAARLDDAEPKVRAAAVRSVALLRGIGAAAVLVPLLDDPDGYVRESTVRELRRLSTKDFGFDPRGPEESRRAAAGRWREWAEAQ